LRCRQLFFPRPLPIHEQKSFAGWIAEESSARIDMPFGGEGVELNDVGQDQ
jgi:hypothetical protein